MMKSVSLAWDSCAMYGKPPWGMLGERGLETKQRTGEMRRWRDDETKVVVMMRRHTAPAHAKGGEGLNL